MVEEGSVKRTKRMGRLKSCVGIWACVFLLAAPALAASSKPVFPRFQELDANVAFWTRVFTEWTGDQVVFHDPYHLDLIYSTLDLSDLTQSTTLSAVAKESAIRRRRAAEGARVVDMLRGLAKGRATTPSEKLILKELKGLGRQASYGNTLASRVRSQRGLGHKFCDSVARAASYLPMIQEAMVAQGVPEDLAALPLVESGYQIGAFSSVGAAGMWQFMRSTGKMYITVDALVDERRDPRQATEAAAKLLKAGYDRLGTWPLAITAYNHGMGGMANAVKQLGTTDMGVIAENYKGRTFGFASRNFYAEFLAARDSLLRAPEICGQVEFQPYRPDRVKLPAWVNVSHISAASGLSPQQIAELNPALASSVVSGKYHLPRGYHLNLPRGTSASFQSAFAELPGRSLLTAQASYTTYHNVARGQTLSGIASRYRTSVSTLQSLNGIRNPRHIRVGQRIKIPGSSSAKATAKSIAKPVAKPSKAAASATSSSKGGSAKPTATVSHTVARGQTLSQIAVMYKTSVRELQSANGIRDPRDLRQGQRLKVQASGSAIAGSSKVAATKSHKVRGGESLWTIARAYGTSVGTLQSLNRLNSRSTIKAGQSLRVPAAGSGRGGETHTVSRGQTLSTIASRYGTSVDALKRENGIRDPRRIQSGQVLRLPD
jgi:membrane-bound lytic murein transglycosylase D